MVDRARPQLLVRILAVLSLAPACGGPDAAIPAGSADGTDAAGPAPMAATCPQTIGPDVDWGGKPPGSYGDYNSVCFPLPPEGAKGCAKISNACILSRYQCGKASGGDKVLEKLTSKGQPACCWKVKGGCAVGRPFVIAGTAVTAELRAGTEWSSAVEAHAAAAFAGSLDEATRAVIAAAWSADGLAEHASIASFAQFVLELLSHGAPAELVAAAQRALGEEVRHAQRAFSLAALYGAEVEPGPLPIAGALSGPRSLADFAARTASEGCIAETVCALQLHAAAAGAADPHLAALLRATAAEETEHALLAWKSVAFAIDRGGEPVRVAVRAVFARAAAHVGFGPCPTSGHDDDLRAHGVLPERDRHDLAVAALADVIGPAARALLDVAPPRPSTREPAAVSDS